MPVGFTTFENIPNVADYGDYRMSHDYMTDQGLISVPIAGATEAFVTIRVHGGIGFRNVDWVASRAGRPPIIPGIYGNSTVEGEDQLRNYSVTFMQTPNTSQNGYNWEVKGRYTYVQSTIREPGIDVFPTNSYPFPVEPMHSQSVKNLLDYGAALTLPISMWDVGVELQAAAVAGRTINWPHTFFPPQASNAYVITITPTGVA